MQSDGDIMRKHIGATLTARWPGMGTEKYTETLSRNVLRVLSIYSLV